MTYFENLLSSRPRLQRTGSMRRI